VEGFVADEKEGAVDRNLQRGNIKGRVLDKPT
jgi:hypothetical protein